MKTHESVLLQESISGLGLRSGDTVIDATLGLGGHSAALAATVGERGLVLGIDADREAIALATERLKGAPATMKYVEGNFRDIGRLAHEAGIEHAHGILFDLGWNATQLAGGRGFSFSADEPLRMTLAASPEEGTLTARTIVNEWSESDLAEVLRTLGEERFSGRIARAIVARRKERSIEKANELADIVAQAVPKFYRHGKTNPATKTFQALRIMVNEELSALETALKDALGLLTPHGRIAVITFHSLEDGLVKRLFRECVRGGQAIHITKKPIAPSREEILKNPRSRSAKLRIIEKT